MPRPTSPIQGQAFEGKTQGRCAEQVVRCRRGSGSGGGHAGGGGLDGTGLTTASQVCNRVTDA